MQFSAYLFFLFIVSVLLGVSGDWVSKGKTAILFSNSNTSPIAAFPCKSYFSLTKQYRLEWNGKAWIDLRNEQPADMTEIEKNYAKVRMRDFKEVFSINHNRPAFQTIKIRSDGTKSKPTRYYWDKNQWFCVDLESGNEPFSVTDLLDQAMWDAAR